ncbi:helix-turn-helix domain-containing protein [Gordonia asplenii]|uniref:helix-turn-helix domain-containing protein n=1 Tax=Gordonia asplenii TaxID=2725283 RepID=UPI0028A858A3|nr:helix-turn-helix domain-containing protein [Gordonia asplenii]
MAIEHNRAVQMNDKRNAVSHGSIVENAWRRSRRSGISEAVEPGAIALTAINEDSRLQRTADRILHDVVEDLDGESLGVMITDTHGVILQAVAGNYSFADALRHARAEPGMTFAEDVLGANAVGTVIESGLGVHFSGQEHFNESMREFACMAIPIHEQHCHRALGVVNMCAHVSDEQRLSAPFIRSILRQVLQGYADIVDGDRKRLFSRYETACERYGSVVAVSADSLFVSNEAMRTLTADDIRCLQDWVDLPDTRGDDCQNILARGIRIVDMPGDAARFGALFWVPQRRPPVVDEMETKALISSARNRQRIDVIERDAVVQALRVNNGNKMMAARWLGVSRRTIYNKISRFRISTLEYSGELD